MQCIILYLHCSDDIWLDISNESSSIFAAANIPANIPSFLEFVWTTFNYNIFLQPYFPLEIKNFVLIENCIKVFNFPFSVSVIKRSTNGQDISFLCTRLYYNKTWRKTQSKIICSKEEIRPKINVIGIKWKKG